MYVVADTKMGRLIFNPIYSYIHIHTCTYIHTYSLIFSNHSFGGQPCSGIIRDPGSVCCRAGWVPLWSLYVQQQSSSSMYPYHHRLNLLGCPLQKMDIFTFIILEQSKNKCCIQCSVVTVTLVFTMIAVSHFWLLQICHNQMTGTDFFLTITLQLLDVTPVALWLCSSSCLSNGPAASTGGSLASVGQSVNK